MIRHPTICIVVGLLPFLLPRLTSEGERQAKPLAFRTDTRLVLARFLVLDRHGKTVEGLQAQNFTILDEQRPQRIVSFSREDAPCSVSIVLDLSGSMEEGFAAAADVVHNFVETANPDDEFSLLAVSTQPHAILGFTSATGVLERSIGLHRPEGLTALIDTVYLGLSIMREAKRPRRAMLILSDGLDNHSRYTNGELRSFAHEADVQIYTILVGVSEPVRGAVQPQ